MTMTDDLAADMLTGVAAIAEFVFGSRSVEDVRKARHWIDRGHLQVHRPGPRAIIAFRSEITRTLRNAPGEPAAPPAPAPPRSRNGRKPARRQRL
jgi:hypothetical protein